MREEIDWKKELLESGKFNNKFSKNILKKWRKELYARNLYGIYLQPVEKN